MTVIWRTLVGTYRGPTLFACSVFWRISPSRPNQLAGDGYCLVYTPLYIRAAALAQGKLDQMPTSHPEAPFSISAVAD